MIDIPENLNRFNSLADSSFTPKQRHLLFGTLLGDGNLQNTGANWRYRALHQNLQKDYLFHKYNVLKDYCQTPPKYRKFQDKRTNTVCERWSFNTLTSPYLLEYAEMFYTLNPETNRYVKHVPTDEQLAANLTPQAIAYWFGDDGYAKWIGDPDNEDKKSSCAMGWCTDSFSKEDCDRLLAFLEQQMKIPGLKLQKRTQKNGQQTYRLVSTEESHTALTNILAPNLFPDFYYKLPDKNGKPWNFERVLEDIRGGNKEELRSEEFFELLQESECEENE
jgi:hypothetical protein